MPNIMIVDIIAGPCPGPDGCPVEVTPNNGGVCQDSPYLFIAGECFDLTAANNTVTFNLGAAGIVSLVSGPTALTVTFTTLPTSTGVLTAAVSNGNGNSGSPVQVATIIPPCGTGCSFSRIPQPTYNSNGIFDSEGRASATCEAGETLVVKVTLLIGDYANVVTCTWNGQTLTKDQDASTSGGITNGRALIFSCATAGAATADVIVTVDGTVGTDMTIQPIRLIGSAANLPDVGSTGNGAASAPNAGPTAPTANNCEIAEAVVLRIAASGVAASWLNDFIGSGYIAQADGADVDEGWKLLDTSGSTATAAIAEAASERWAAAVEVYK